MLEFLDGSYIPDMTDLICFGSREAHCSQLYQRVDSVSVVSVSDFGIARTLRRGRGNEHQSEPKLESSKVNVQKTCAMLSKSWPSSKCILSKVESSKKLKPANLESSKS